VFARDSESGENLTDEGNGFVQEVLQDSVVSSLTPHALVKNPAQLNV